MTTIYKICEAHQWMQVERDGEFRGSLVDLADGYIHFSTAAQVAGTAAKHFAALSGLVLVAVEAEELGAALKWERSRGGDLFLHFYGALPLTAIRWVKPMDDLCGGDPTPSGGKLSGPRGCANCRKPAEIGSVIGYLRS